MCDKSAHENDPDMFGTGGVRGERRSMGRCRIRAEHGADEECISDWHALIGVI
jgi:hypothetical protein